MDDYSILHPLQCFLSALYFLSFFPDLQYKIYGILCLSFFFLRFLFLYLLLERRERRERNINVWLPLTRPLLGTWPATQACALTGNRTGDPLFCRSSLNPRSYTSQGSMSQFLNSFYI